MLYPTYEEARKFEQDYEMIPVCKEIYADVVTPIALLNKILQVDHKCFLLESVEGGEKWGRYSFLGLNPFMHLKAKNGVVEMESGAVKNVVKGNPYEILQQQIQNYRAPRLPEMPPFTGGFVGYFAYEMFSYAEPNLELRSNNQEDLNLMLFHKVIVYDHLKQKIKVIVNYRSKEGKQGYQAAEFEVDKLIHLIRSNCSITIEKPQKEVSFVCNTTKEEYCDMVEKTKNYIKEGDIFQGVISRRFEAEYHSSLFHTYRVLRTTNPSPYMYYIKSDDLEIAGSSPETMVRLQDGELTTFPVAGTRKRGVTVAEDLQLEKELLADEKECAEHNMLVDLARNDIGKIAEYGSVYVEDYMQIHRFSKVMHIASVVKGTLRKEYSGCDTVKALLPAGTLSGAPKFRACQIINELEKDSRGVYGGAIGYLDLSENLDVCIAIRTAIKQGDKVYVQAGAGVVADSISENEYLECQNKASAVMEAIKKASEVDA